MPVQPATIDRQALVRRHQRAVAIAAVVTALVATGGYAATKTAGLDAHNARPVPEGGPDIDLSHQVMRELRYSTANLNGPATSRNIAPSDEAQRQLDQTARHLYGPRR